jgi:hypothetical protein
MSNAATGADRQGMHPSQILTLVIGAAYTLGGLAGFLVTGLDNFAGITDRTLLGFEINPLHNIVHLVIGILGLLMFRTLASARGYGWVLAIGYGAAFLYGLLAVGNPDINLLSINQADNVLHAVSALAGLVIALWPARDHANARTATAR